MRHGICGQPHWLGGAETPLALFFRVIPNALTRIRYVGSQPTHLGDHLEAAVWLLRDVPEIMVELCYVRASDFRDGQSADCGQDEALEVSTILLRRASLQAHRDMLLVEAVSQIADGSGAALGGPISRRILAVLDGGDDGDRLGARLIAG